MLNINASNIYLNQQASSKEEAITTIAQLLVDKGNVQKGYQEGMLARENQNSTFLGNGIAIPHGTTQTRDLVLNTGVVLLHFKEGVDWGDGNTVFLAIGIAAKSDEHLSILKQLTQLLSDDEIEHRLKSITNQDGLLALFSKKKQSSPMLSKQSILTQYPASKMVQLKSIAAGLLSQSEVLNHSFFTEFMNKTPTHLNSGVWLLAVANSVNTPNVAFVSALSSFTFNGLSCQSLIAIAGVHHDHSSLMIAISRLLQNDQLQYLSSASAEEVINSLTTGAFSKKTIHTANTHNTDASTTSSIVEAQFVIHNAHGLHARPSTVLVNEAKKYQSQITLQTNEPDSEPVNAKSLMKIMTLGVKTGSLLKFRAQGEDAAQAIEGIKKAIESGLGE